MYPLITIQILNWNRAADTLNAIESAFKQTYPNLEIVIIDNGSSDNSVSSIRNTYPNLLVVELDQNYGCPGGRNRGISYCNGEYIFYLDNDGELHQDAVMNAYKSITRRSNIGVVTGMVYDYLDKSEIDTKCTIKSHSKYSFNNFQGGICLHDKSIYSKVGYYPDHFMYGAEEYFLTLKLFDAGIVIIKDESVVLWHVRSSVARNRAKELINAYFNKLYVSISTFPTISAIKFGLYFVPMYLIYAKKEGIMKGFIKSLTTRLVPTVRKAMEAREPISQRAYLEFKNFKSVPIS